MTTTHISTVGIPPALASLYAKSIIAATESIHLISSAVIVSASYPFFILLALPMKDVTTTITHATTPTARHIIFIWFTGVENTLPEKIARNSFCAAREILPVVLFALRSAVPQPLNARYPARVAIHGGISTYAIR